MLSLTNKNINFTPATGLSRTIKESGRMGTCLVKKTIDVYQSFYFRMFETLECKLSSMGKAIDVPVIMKLDGVCIHVGST